MILTNIRFTGNDNVAQELTDLNKVTYFQVITNNIDDYESISEAFDLIRSIYPDVPCFAFSTAGNIINYVETNDVDITAVTFEDPSTTVNIQIYDVQNEEALKKNFTIVRQYIIDHPDTKAIEIYHPIPQYSLSMLCDLCNVPGSPVLKDIPIFGGVVCSPDLLADASIIATPEEGILHNKMIAMIYSGENLHVKAFKISGWRGIGHAFRITKANDNVINTLDNMPAYTVYKKYLGIENNQNFFKNALEFPFIYKKNETDITRAVATCLPDGSLVLSSDIDEGEYVQISYGDPNTIIDEVKRIKQTQIDKFCPDCLKIISCAARKAFWEEDKSTYELAGFDNDYPQSGFFSHGEFIRENNFLSQHNMTLVVAAFREFEPKRNIVDDTSDVEIAEIPLVARMARFISQVTYEMEQVNDQLIAMNNQLENIATVDSLTGLGNRYSFDACLNDIYSDDKLSSKNYTMLMCDVNGLKYVNDTFGHDAGDELIKAAGDVINAVYGDCGYCFRIGGDEFTIIADGNIKKQRELQRRLVNAIETHNKTAIYHLSMSIGSASIKTGAGVIKTKSDWKLDADLSMYKEKALVHKEFVRTERDKDKNLQELIDCIISIVEAKDPYTAHHSERVKELSCLIAKLLGLSQDTIKNITDAATLHDVGKMGISDAILMKPSRLNDEEYEIIKTHPVIGGQILMKSNYAHDLVDMVIHHHERWDGKGYPDGISGDAIPIGARIIAIADSIDAMTSKRCYRDSLSIDYCKEEIQKNLGIMYDPAIARIVLDHWSEVQDVLFSNPKLLF